MWMIMKMSGGLSFRLGLLDDFQLDIDINCITNQDATGFQGNVPV